MSVEAALTKGLCNDDALGERTGSGRMEQSYRSGGNGELVPLLFLFDHVGGFRILLRFFLCFVT